MTSSNLEPDLIFVNANVYTMNTLQPRAAAIAIHHSKIVAVGQNNTVMSLQGPSTQVVNLNGKLVLPGFIDSHIHFHSFVIGSYRTTLLYSENL